MGMSIPMAVTVGAPWLLRSLGCAIKPKVCANFKNKAAVRLAPATDMAKKL